MAKAEPIPGIAADARFGDVAAAAVQTRTREVFAHSAGVLDLDDPKRVHAMRVATRRLRSALEVFATCFPRKPHRRLLREVKALADALGQRRDPDVAVERLHALADAFNPADRPGVAGLAAELAATREQANHELAAALEEVERRELERRLLDLAAEARR